MLRILLVDDHVLLRVAIARTLGSLHQDYFFYHASNGDEALSILNEENIDLMLLDIQMPVKNGIDTFKEFKRLGLNTKVIILTMLGEASLIIHLLKLGANGFLLKDCEIEELEEAISKTMTEGGYHGNIVEIAMKEFVRYPDLFPNLNLSPREFQVLELIKNGLSNKDMARHLHLGVNTIESYRKALMEKTKCNNTADLVTFAYKIGASLPDGPNNLSATRTNSTL